MYGKSTALKREELLTLQISVEKMEPLETPIY
jgi:hypothetical protein